MSVVVAAAVIVALIGPATVVADANGSEVHVSVSGSVPAAGLLAAHSSCSPSWFRAISPTPIAHCSVARSHGTVAPSYASVLVPLPSG